jgi:hypothetical protein
MNKRKSVWEHVQGGGYNPPSQKEGIENKNINTSFFTCREMKAIVGYQGKRLKMWTELHKVDYIWFRKEKHQIEIWGPNENVKECQNSIQLYLEEKINLKKQKVLEN